jgi:hypothetical protein
MSCPQRATGVQVFERADKIACKRAINLLVPSALRLVLVVVFTLASVAMHSKLRADGNKTKRRMRCKSAVCSANCKMFASCAADTVLLGDRSIDPLFRFRTTSGRASHDRNAAGIYRSCSTTVPHLLRGNPLESTGHTV